MREAPSNSEMCSSSKKRNKAKITEDLSHIQNDWVRIALSSDYIEPDGRKKLHHYLFCWRHVVVLSYKYDPHCPPKHQSLSNDSDFKTKILIFIWNSKKNLKNAFQSCYSLRHVSNWIVCFDDGSAVAPGRRWYVIPSTSAHAIHGNPNNFLIRRNGRSRRWRWTTWTSSEAGHVRSPEHLQCQSRSMRCSLCGNGSSRWPLQFAGSLRLPSLNVSPEIICNWNICRQHPTNYY